MKPLLAITAATLLSGCMTPRQFFYLGVAADVGSTAVMLNQDGYYEANPLAEDAEDIAVLSVGLIAGVEAAAAQWPDDADSFYVIGGVLKLLAGLWNVGLMAEEGI